VPAGEPGIPGAKHLQSQASLELSIPGAEHPRAEHPQKQKHHPSTIKDTEPLNYRITESQNSRGWKGPLWVI